MGVPASAEGDFVLILRALRDQLSHRQLPTSEKGKAIETEAEGLLRKVALVRFFSDERLAVIDVSRRLDPPVKEALGTELEGGDPLALVNAYASSSGNYKKFAKLVAVQTYTHPVNFKTPEARKATERLWEALTKLESEGIAATYSGRYQEARWTFDVSASWLPFKRRASVYVVGSAPSPGGRAKSLTLNVAGSVVPRPGAAKPHSFSVSLDEVDFHANSSELELSGRWNHRFEPSTGTVVNLSNLLTLKVVDTGVSGKLVQEVLTTDPKGRVASGRLNYALTGTLSSTGEMQGTFEATGDSRGMQWLEDPPPDKIRGTWQGKLDRGSASGSLTLRGKVSVTMPWEAREQK